MTESEAAADVVGKVIKRVVALRYNVDADDYCAEEWSDLYNSGVGIEFTDGSTIRFTPDGWECDGVNLDYRTKEAA